MVGTQLTYNIHDYVLKDLEDSHEPSPLLKEMIDEGKEIEVKCHFCNTAYKYTVDELKELLKQAR